MIDVGRTGHTLVMSSSTIAFVVVAAVVFFGLVFFAVNAFGTRLTGKQIDEDPDVRASVDPKDRDEDFPVNADF